MKTLRYGAAIAAALALTLTACGNGDATGGSADGDSAAGTQLSGELNGQGASSMEAAQAAWIQAFQTNNPDVTVNYSADGSGAGRTGFADGSADFAGSDAFLTDEELATSGGKCAADGTPINLPVYISPIAIAYNLDGVDELNLTAEVIAKIFKGDITKWNDSAITALNEGTDLPDLAITPVHRADGSGTTENFTETLSQVAPDIWTYEVDDEWPLENGEAANQTPGVQSAINNGSGYIGYLDASAVVEGMKTVNYAADADSQYFGPTAEDAAAVVAASAKVDGRGENDWSLNLDRNAAGYPFVLVSYAVACQQYEDPALGELVGAYLKFVTSPEGQQAAVANAGNAPLSGELSDNVQAAAATIK